MAELERYDNRLGLWGWLGGGRWGIERYAYILHRVTGLGILAYFLMHVVVTSLRAKGIYLWADARTSSACPFSRSANISSSPPSPSTPSTGSGSSWWSSDSPSGSPSSPSILTRLRSTCSAPSVIMMVLAAMFLMAGSYEFIFGD